MLSLLPAFSPASTKLVFFAHAAGGPPAVAGDERLGLIAGERGQGARDYDGLARQRVGERVALVPAA